MKKRMFVVLFMVAVAGILAFAPPVAAQTTPGALWGMVVRFMIRVENLEVRFAQALTRVGTLEQRADNHDTADASHQSQLDALASRVQSLEQRADGHDTADTDLQNQNNALASRVQALESCACPVPPPQPTCSGMEIVCDGFESYADGEVLGSGGWDSTYPGSVNYLVQGTTVHAGAKAIAVSAFGDSVIWKAGIPQADGQQTVYVRTIFRRFWSPHVNGNAQFRVSQGRWGEFGLFAAVAFRSSGSVAYYSPLTGTYVDFASYNDMEWTKLDIAWRSSDRAARYRVNDGAWTNWTVFEGFGSPSFTGFDHVGMDFQLTGGSGGVFFDSLQ